MTSVFTASEVVPTRPDPGASTRSDLQIVAGGSGLGRMARAILKNRKVADPIVVKYPAPVWHDAGILQIGTGLVGVPRRHRVSDFRPMAEDEAGLDPLTPGRQSDAVPVGIDHAPDHLMDDRSTDIHRAEGLAAISRHLEPGGVFWLRSNEHEDPRTTRRLDSVFVAARAGSVTFDDPLTGPPFTRTVHPACEGDA